MIFCIAASLGHAVSQIIPSHKSNAHNMLRTIWLIALLWIAGCNARTLESELAQEPQPANAPNAVDIKMVLVPAGTFMMGGPSVGRMANRHATPPHEVTLTTPFYLGIYEVTNEQYAAVMGHRMHPYPKGEENLPVTMVTWENAIEFCEKLSALPDSVAEARFIACPRRLNGSTHVEPAAPPPTALAIHPPNSVTMHGLSITVWLIPKPTRASRWD